MKKITILKIVFLLFFSSTVFAQANLVLTSGAVLTPAVKRGDNLSLSLRVSNIGNAAAGLSHIKIYVSPALSFNNAILLSEISCEALPSGQQTKDINFVYSLPYTATVGTNYILAVVDSRNEVAESDETNGYSFATTFTVSSTYGGKQNLPYPVILIHGLNGNDTTWYPFLKDMQAYYGFSYGGDMNFCLNQDGNKNTSTLPNDFRDWTNEASLFPGDFFTVNFNVSTSGNKYSSATESNQSGIVKQGIAIQKAIQHVLNVTGKQKVILAGHSMGGLAAREYLQNSAIWQLDGQHHVAKLYTTGTPHGGSNSTMLGLGFDSLDEKSEAVRDLRRTYAISGDSGVYLYGGLESTSVMWNNLFFDYNNVDVNCNGVIGNNIIGLNHKNIPNDLVYTCTIGVDNYFPPLCSDCDGVVGETEANLNNYYNLSADTFMCVGTGAAAHPFHLDLPKKTDFMMKGLDEANDYDKSYDINSDNLYFGNFTVQSLGGAYTIDYDDYKFSVPTTQMLNIKVYDLPLSNCKIEILDLSYNSIYSITSNGQSSLNINVPINAGNYYFEVSATAENVSWYYPYAIKLSFTGGGVCPTSNIAFKAGVVGSTYQWQVNTGSGYANINNSSIYSGATSSSLQLNSPPTSWYGYSYRCLVNGTTYSPETTLKFSVRWLGSVSTAWENPLNWNCGILPDSSTDVIISSGVVNYPEVNTNVFCRSINSSPTTSIIIKSGANLTITK